MKHDQIHDLQRHHSWWAVLELEHAFDSRVTNAGVDWARIARAAYHAGAACALYQARADIPEEGDGRKKAKP